MNKRILLIDGNNSAWASFHAYSSLSYKGHKVGMMYGLPQMLRSWCQEIKPSDAIVAWDGTRSKERIALLPDYKGGRNHKLLIDMDNWGAQYNELQRMIHTLGVKQICKGEADDMIYKLTLKAIEMGYKEVFIASSDKDFNQMLNIPGVTIYNIKRKKMITRYNCNAEFGYHHYQLVDWLTFLGDNSDNIPGYPGIGDVKAKKFFEIHSTIKSFLQKKDKFPGIDKDKLYDLVIRNETLINLETFHQMYGKDIPIKFLFKNPKPDKQGFLEICGKFGMQKMMSGNFFETLSNSFKSK